MSSTSAPNAGVPRRGADSAVPLAAWRGALAEPASAIPCPATRRTAVALARRQRAGYFGRVEKNCTGSRVHYSGLPTPDGWWFDRPEHRAQTCSRHRQSPRQRRVHTVTTSSTPPHATTGPSSLSPTGPGRHARPRCCCPGQRPARPARRGPSRPRRTLPRRGSDRLAWHGTPTDNSTSTSPITHADAGRHQPARLGPYDSFNLNEDVPVHPHQHAMAYPEAFIGPHGRLGTRRHRPYSSTWPTSS